MFSESVVRSAKPSSPSIRVWKTLPAREPVGEERVREDGAAVDVDAAALRDLDVVRDRVDDLRQRDRREALLDLALERLDELLLARDAVQVGVGVPVAHVVERLPAR